MKVACVLDGAGHRCGQGDGPLRRPLERGTPRPRSRPCNNVDTEQEPDRDRERTPFAPPPPPYECTSETRASVREPTFV